MRSIPPSIQKSIPRSAGFTLVELLVVMGIVVLLLGIVGGFSNPGARPAQARDVAAGTIDHARSLALATGAPTRVVINGDSSSADDFLREIVILVDQDQDPSTADWVSHEASRSFPAGTFFWPDYSTSGLTMQFDSSAGHLPQDGASGDTYYFVEFSSIGESTTPGVQWVFAKGVIDGSGATTVPNPEDKDGFILRQTGRLGFFVSAAEIAIP